MNSLFEHRAGPALTPGGWQGVFPPVNLYETTDAYVLTAELAGVEPEDIDVSLEGSTISIQGERKIDFGSYENASTHRRERQSGTFRRAFSLPRKVEADKVEAAHRNGVLMIRVPKSPEARPRQIAVQAK
jgi:HSP20 family protein